MFIVNDLGTAGDLFQAHEGEVLKFMGDGLMGVFLDDDERIEA